MFQLKKWQIKLTSLSLTGNHSEKEAEDKEEEGS